MTELKAIRKDFSTVVAAVSQAYGPDFFGYIQKHWENLDIRRQYKINTPEGYTLFDSSLRERWNAPLVLAAIDKQFKSMGVGSFTSTFGKKAHSDLIAYEALRAKREKEVDELYTRPFEDLVVEEFISNLPVPTIEEVDVPMEQAGGSADAAPADSSLEEMAGGKRQNKSQIPQYLWMLTMFLWTPRHQEALPLKRYLLLRRRILRFHLFNILMILLVRIYQRQHRGSPGKLSLWRGTHTRDEFLCRCLQRSGQHL